MALTKVSGGILDPGINVAGIVTATGFDGPFTGGTSRNITAGIITATGFDLNGNGDISGNLVLGGDLTVNGTTTTLDTNLIGVDRIEVGANSSTVVGVAITQSGSADLVRLYDGASQVVTVDDEGNVGIGTNTAFTSGAHSGIHQLTVTDQSHPSMTLGKSNTDQLYVRRELADGKYTFQTVQSGGNNGVIALQPYGGNVFISHTASVGSGKLQVFTKTADALDILSFDDTAADGGRLTFYRNRNTTYGSNTKLADDDSLGRIDFRGMNTEGTDNYEIGASIRAEVDGTPGSGTDASDMPGRLMFFTTPDGSDNPQERLRITSDGNVGIGSLTPPTGILLDVQGHAGGGAQHTIRSKSTAANASNFVRSESSDGLYIGLLKYGTGHSAYGALPAGGGAVYANSSVPITIMSDGGSGYINFATGGNTEKLRITSDGHIVTQGLTSYTFNNDGANTKIFEVTGDGTVGEYGVINISGNQNADDGTLGIIKFVNRENSASSSGSGSGSKQVGSIEMRVETADSNAGDDCGGYMRFITKGDGSGNAERLRIKSDGNVGIGHTNPGEKLEVSGAVQASQGYKTAGHPVVTYASFTDISGGNYATRLGSTGTSTLRSTQIYGGGSHLATFDGVNGRLGIGTAVPATQLHLKSTDPTLRLQRTGQNAYGDITADTAGKIIFKSDPGGSASGDGFSFTIDNSEKLNIDSDGITVTGEVAASQDYPNFRPTLDFNFAAEKKLDPRITYERTGPASFVNELGKVVLVGDNVPRFDHDPITKECKGLLIEKSSTNRNMCTTFRRSHSGRFGMNSADEQLSGLNTNGVVSPYGTAVGVARAFFTGSESDPSGSVYAMASTSSSNGAHYTTTATHTSSVWIRTGLETVFKLQAHSNYASASAAGSPETIDFTFTLTGDGTVTSIESGGIAASVTKYPNNWYRCTLTYHRNSTSNVQSAYGVIVYPVNYASYNANSQTGDIFWVWGPQVETSSFPTSYIQNENDGTFGSRGEDVVLIDGTEFTDFFNADEGTSVVHAHMPNSDGSAGLAAYAFKNSSNSNVHLGLSRDSNASPAYHYYHDGSNSGFSRASATADNMYKGALSFKTSDLDSYVNGSLNTNTTTFTMPTIDNLRIGGVGSPNQLGGHVARFMYYPVKLTNSQMITITS